MLKIYGLDVVDFKRENRGEYLGKFNGIEFISDKHSLRHLKQFNYLQIYINRELRYHRSKRFNQDIEKSLQEIYTREFGEIAQLSLL